MTDKKTKVKKPDSAASSSRASVKAEMVITPQMTKQIQQGKKDLKDGYSKMDTAKEIFKALNKTHERRQIIHVFINGASLTKNGSATYYTMIKNKG